MRWVGPLLARLRVGRFRDWYRFTYARLRSPGSIVAEGLPFIDPPFTLRMSPASRLVIGRDVTFRSGFCAELDGHGVLEVAEGTVFNVSCWIGVTTRVSIGPHCLLGPFVTVTDGNHNFDVLDVPIVSQGVDTREIEIGADVWVGAKATVIESIGRGAVIGANAVVSRPVPPMTVAAGVPARVVRDRGRLQSGTAGGSHD